MTYREFSSQVMVSVEGMCRDFFRKNRENIRVKKEEVAVRNLVAIVNATLSLSCGKGFDAMSLRDLSSESGLSMGALYSYFSSKEELLGLVQYHGRAAVIKILNEQIGREGGARERLRNAIRTHIYLSELMSQWFYFLFMETKNLDKKHRKISMESELMTEKIITDILSEGIKQRVFAVRDVQLTGSVIKAMMQDWYLKQWKYSQRGVSVDEYAQCIIEVIESYILKDAVAATRGGGNGTNR